MRITNNLTLHLIYRYLSCIIINELNEAVTLTNKNPNIYNVFKALKV